MIRWDVYFIVPLTNEYLSAADIALSLSFVIQKFRLRCIQWYENKKGKVKSNW